jgi:hypothetical protein
MVSGHACAFNHGKARLLRPETGGMANHLTASAIAENSKHPQNQSGNRNGPNTRQNSNRKTCTIKLLDFQRKCSTHVILPTAPLLIYQGQCKKLHRLEKIWRLRDTREGYVVILKQTGGPSLSYLSRLVAHFRQRTISDKHTHTHTHTHTHD